MKRDMSTILQYVVFIILFLVCLFSALEIHEKQVLGWDKDCREQIKGIENEIDMPMECQWMGKYWFMLLFTVGFIVIAMSMMAVLISSTVQYDEEEKWKKIMRQKLRERNVK